MFTVVSLLYKLETKIREIHQKNLLSLEGMYIQSHTA